MASAGCDRRAPVRNAPPGPQAGLGPHRAPICLPLLEGTWTMYRFHSGTVAKREIDQLRELASPSGNYFYGEHIVGEFSAPRVFSGRLFLLRPRASLFSRLTMNQTRGEIHTNAGGHPAPAPYRRTPLLGLTTSAGYFPARLVLRVPIHDGPVQTT